MKILVLVVLLLPVLGQRSGTGKWSTSLNSIRGAFDKAQKWLQDTGLYTSELSDSVEAGAKIALQECQSLFKWRPWNCPDKAFSLKGRRVVTKESAFVMAITAAGFTHVITKNCSRGELSGCGCDTRLPTGIKYREDKSTTWQWGGCSDDVGYGEKVASKFLDGLEGRGQDAVAIARLHNNMVGRMAVRNSMKKECRCHGVTGSCAVKTCWNTLPTFQEVAKNLYDQYFQATRIDYEGSYGSEALGNTPTVKQPEVANQLVFLEKSPNYCLKNTTTGWPGVKGRSCSIPSSDREVSNEEKESCLNICETCGMEVGWEKKQVEPRCKCTFKWCCEVECHSCQSVVDHYFCQ